METLKHPACTISSVAQLSQLAFPGKSGPNIPWERFQLESRVKKKEKEVLYLEIIECLWIYTV